MYIGSLFPVTCPVFLDVASHQRCWFPPPPPPPPPPPINAAASIRRNTVSLQQGLHCSNCMDRLTDCSTPAACMHMVMKAYFGSQPTVLYNACTVLADLTLFVCVVCVCGNVLTIHPHTIHSLPPSLPPSLSPSLLPPSPSLSAFLPPSFHPSVPPSLPSLSPFLHSPSQVSPEHHEAADFDFDVLVDADGHRSTIPGFDRKEL